MQYWWVNQNQTYKHEVAGSYMWSPKTNANGAYNRFYDNMQRVNPGDVIFSFCDTLIKAIGIASGKALTAPKPTEFGAIGNSWGEEGWFVPVEYEELDHPIRPKDHIAMIRPSLPDKYSPLQSNGNGLQSVYLASVPQPMAQVLQRLLNGQVEAIQAALGYGAIENFLEDNAEAEIRTRSDIPETEKDQLVKARRGQGLFRSRVALIEKSCRVTGIDAKEHLRASHIKPWRLSDNREKLDGNNGLLLAPHIDHLFDRGYISFNDDGSILVSQLFNYLVAEAWQIDLSKNVGEFNHDQKRYLAFHRRDVFKS